MSLHDRGAPAPIRRAVLPTPRFVLLFAISAPIALLIVSLRPEAWRFALLYPVAALALFAADLTMTLPQNRLRVCARVPARLTPGKRRECGEGVTLALEAEGWPRSVVMEVLPELTGDALPPCPARAELRGELALSLPLEPTRRGRADAGRPVAALARPLGTGGTAAASARGGEH